MAIANRKISQNHFIGWLSSSEKGNFLTRRASGDVDLSLVLGHLSFTALWTPKLLASFHPKLRRDSTEQFIVSELHLHAAFVLPIASGTG